MSKQETRKESSPSYLIRRNLQCLANTAERTIEQVSELEDKKPPAGLSHEKTIEWLVQQKSRIEKQVIVIDGIISKANKLEIEWKELLRSANDGEWENDVKLYEDYLYEEDCLFDTGSKIYSTRASLLTELNRVNEALKEIKGKCEVRGNESTIEEGKKKSLEELIEKLITTSKPPTLSPVEFNGNPRMWGQFIKDSEEKPAIKSSIDRTKMQRAKSYGREYPKWENDIRRTTVCSTAKEKIVSLAD
ncbi:hypothetical protein X798_02453 [Onchocerca flexuosa]|uniref:Uncharacterized protein n=1 Tax=Onchocerca flexuosa TaxID=387005 RepID=A0A238C0B5_9BILA|nr:hypothetical protein X798_02453 [Onchocerca flexuosa]